MFDIATLTSIAPIVIGFATFVFVTRLIADGEPGDIARIFGTPWDPAWPRGVQEEEAAAWRLDLLDGLNPRPHVVPNLGADEDCEDCAEEAA